MNLQVRNHTVQTLTRSMHHVKNNAMLRQLVLNWMCINSQCRNWSEEKPSCEPKLIVRVKTHVTPCDVLSLCSVKNICSRRKMRYCHGLSRSSWIHWVGVLFKPCRILSRVPTMIGQNKVPTGFFRQCEETAPRIDMSKFCIHVYFKHLHAKSPGIEHKKRFAWNGTRWSCIRCKIYMHCICVAEF